MTKPILIIGTGSQARYVIDIAAQLQIPLLGLADIEHEPDKGESINGVPLLCQAKDVVKRYSPNDCSILIAYGKNRRKQELADFFSKQKFTFASAISPQAYCSPNAEVGRGCIINPGAVILANARIGDHVIVHSGTVVEHDNDIQDFANLAPGVTLAGRVTVGRGAVIYTGAKVIPDITIGQWAEVAAGSLVTKNVPDEKRVGGVPARALRGKLQMTKPLIPFFGTAREFASLSDPIMAQVKAAYQTGQTLQGPPVEALERRMASLTNRKFGVAVNSCTDALFFALVAAGINAGDEVLVTNFSFIASASCIARTGAKPVFVDVGDDFNIDLQLADRAVTSKTRALVLVHLYGQMISPALAEQFCQRHKLTLIEDAAQAFGSRWDDRPAGSLGLASCISFDPTKPISAPGSGGMLLTNDETMAQRARRLRYHGREQGKTEFSELGYNSQMPTATAAVLNIKLDHADKWLERRREIAASYTRGLSDLEPMVLPKESKLHSHNYHKYVLLVSGRDALRASLSAGGIESFIHYPAPLHRQPCFEDLKYTDIAYLRSLSMTQRVLSLPIHPFVSDKEIELIVKTIHRHYQRSS